MPNIFFFCNGFATKFPFVNPGLLSSCQARSLSMIETTCYQVLYVSLRPIYHCNSSILLLPTDEMLLQRKKQIQHQDTSGKDHATAFGCQTEPRFPCSHFRSWDLTLLRTYLNSPCSQQTFDNPLVRQGGHNLKVPLQAVYWGLLSHKWSPDIFYPFFLFPLLNIKMLHKDDSEHLERQSLFKLWWQNGWV